LGLSTVRDALASSYAVALSGYGRHPPDRELSTAVDSLLEDGHSDFGRLTAGLQRRVIEQVALDGAKRCALLAENPAIERALDLDVTADGVRCRIASNARVVRGNYSLEQCGQRLSRCYRNLLEDAATGRDGRHPSHAVNGHEILDAFLRLERFHAISIP
jgi:hypothetical protein